MRTNLVPSFSPVIDNWLGLSVITFFLFLSSELSAGWAGVWPRLLEHMQLLHHCGREIDELAAIFTPALIVTDSPAKREKVCGEERERGVGG